MCLVTFAVGVSRRYPLILAANRDERHARPTLAAAWWSDNPAAFGGRDLVALGTWLAADRDGRIAAVTNVRESTVPIAARSRGKLVSDYLARAHTARGYAAALAERADRYGPFSLLLFDGGAAFYVSNRAPSIALSRGVHALSNAPLGADWAKERTARAGLERLLNEPDPTDGLLELLALRSAASAAEQRYREAHFVEGPVYGTRCSTVVLVDSAGVLSFAERSFDASARPTGEVRERFAVGGWASTAAPV